MKTNESASTLDIGIQRGFVGIAQISRVALVDHHDVGAFEIGGARCMQCAVHDGSMLRKNLTPVGKKLWIVMLTRAMRFQTAPDVDMHSVSVLPRCLRNSRAPSRLRPSV